MVRTIYTNLRETDFSYKHYNVMSRLKQDMRAEKSAFEQHKGKFYIICENTMPTDSYIKKGGARTTSCFVSLLLDYYALVWSQGKTQIGRDGRVS